MMWIRFASFCGCGVLAFYALKPGYFVLTELNSSQLKMPNPA
jgi:hypothetical protein